MKVADGRHVVTDADAVEYERHMREWQKKLGLSGWRIVHSPIPAKKAMAEMDKFDWRQRQVTARLGREWLSSPVTPVTLEQTAVHELLHLLLFPLAQAAGSGTAMPDDEVASLEHSIINTLETLLVPDA